MKLSPSTGLEIISRAKLVLNREILVSDDRGVVIAGGDGAGASGRRIVVDALRACQEGRVVRAEFGDELVVWCPFVYENRTVGAFGIIESGAQTTPEAISLLQGLAEVITHQHFLLAHVQPTDKVRATFLKQVLSSNSMDATETYRQADILQMNLRSPQAIMLVEVEDFEKTVTGDTAPTSEDAEQIIATESERVRTLILQAFKGNGGNIGCYIGKNQLIVSKGITGEGLTTRNTLRYLTESAETLFKTLTKALPKQTITIGVGQYYPDLGGLRKSYQEAKLSLMVGSKVWGIGRVYHIKEVGMYVTLANVAQERKAELAHQILHPLLRDEQLYKTVQTFLASGLNLTEAAEKLHVHRNTLIYRLDKTKKAIGLDPRVFDDALQIKLGLMFYQET